MQPLTQSQPHASKLMTSPLAAAPSAVTTKPQTFRLSLNNATGPSGSPAAPLVDLKSLVFDGVAVHVWATRQNRLMLMDGPDKADMISQRGSIRVLRDGAHVHCEERGVVMEQLRPRDISSVHLHGSATGGGGGVGGFAWTVAVHAHTPLANDEYDGNAWIRRLPNGVVLRGGGSDAQTSQSKRQTGSSSTWATIVIVCGSKDVAQRVHDAIEGLRIRYLQSVPHGSVPEAGVAESAIVLQHKAREWIAKSGLRPDGVASLPSGGGGVMSSALIPAAAKRRESPAPLSPRSFMLLGGNGGGGTTPNSGMSTPPPRSPWGNRRSGGGSAGGNWSLLTSVPRGPLDAASPADAYEVLLGSDDEDRDDDDCSDITFQYEGGRGELLNGSTSSESSVVSSNEDEERAAVVRHAFREPFVPLKRAVQEMLGPRGTWVPPQAGRFLKESKQSDDNAHQNHPSKNGSTVSNVSAVTATAQAPPAASLLSHEPDSEDISLPIHHNNTTSASNPQSTSPNHPHPHHHHSHISQRSSVSGSSGRVHDPLLGHSSNKQPATGKAEPSETERRTQALIEKLRAGFAEAQRQQQQQIHQEHIPHSRHTLTSPEPSMILDAPPPLQSDPPIPLFHQQRRAVSPREGSLGERRPKPLLQVLRRDQLDDANNDASDAESLEFQEEEHQQTGGTGGGRRAGDALDKTLSPSRAEQNRRGATPTKRLSPPRDQVGSAAAGGPGGPRLARATTGLNKSPNRINKTSAIDDAISSARRGSAGRQAISPTAQQSRRSPIVASSRFQLDPGSDAAVLQQQQQQRQRRSSTPVTRPPQAAVGSGRASRVLSPEPEDAARDRDYGHVEPSLAIARSTSPPGGTTTGLPAGSRRCKWCKNVAPESHDDRCAFRKIRCRNC